MIARRILGVLVLAGAVGGCGEGSIGGSGNDGGAGNGGSGSGNGGNGSTGNGGSGNTGTGGSGGGQAPPPTCGSNPFQPPTGGRTYYVAPDGSDSAAGTMAAPFRTMEQAARVAGGGDVVYVRGGVYTRAEDFSASGEPGRPVVFMAMPGEKPIFDAGSLNLGQSESVLQLYQPEHVVIAGLEFRNSDGRGVQLIDAEDVVIRDCVIHDVGYKALGLNGNNLVAEANVIYNAVMSNQSSTSGGGWAAGVTTQLLEDGSPSSNVVVRGNLIHDVWGECIDALFVDGMTIAGNDVRDCFSVGIYIDTARGVRVEGNIVRAVNPSYRRNGNGKLADGILMAAEAGDGSAPNFGAENVVIANNILLGTHTGIGWWDDDSNARASNTYRQVQIVGNVVWGTEEMAISFDKVPSGRTAPSGAVLTNNVLYDGVSIQDPAAWMITANAFPGSKPAIASDPSNLSGDPQLTGPLTVEAAAEAFRPTAGSPLRHAGRPVAMVPQDYACAPRGTTDTTIGAFE